MTRRNSKSSQRVAIEWIKLSYGQGQAFANSAAGCAALQAAIPARFATCTPAQFTLWDRLARYELAESQDNETRLYVTQPVRATGYRRIPASSVTDELVDQTQYIKVRDLAVRAGHQWSIANAAATRSGANARNIRAAAELGVVVRVLGDVLTTMGT